MEKETIKHLEFIQNIITRMNTNSFQIKGWMITIVSALLALYASSDNETTYIFVAIVPTLLFWNLDAYYLQQERKFRELYKEVIQKESNISNFSMSIDKYTDRKCRFWNSFISPTIGWLYGTIVTLLLIGGLILKYKDCITIIFTC